MSYFSKLKCNLIFSNIFVFFILLFGHLYAHYSYSHFYSLVVRIIFLVFVICASVFFYNFHKHTASSIFDKCFIDVMRQYGNDYQLFKCSSLHSNVCIATYNGLNMYLYSNALIIQLDDKAILVSDLSKLTVKNMHTFPQLIFEYNSKIIRVRFTRMPELLIKKINEAKNNINYIKGV